MGRFFPGTRHWSLVLAILIMTTSLVQAGDFAVNGRTGYKVKRSELQAVQHLARATFGYTDADIDALADRIRQIGHRRALAEWIDNQTDPGITPASLHESLVLQLLTDDQYVDDPNDPEIKFPYYRKHTNDGFPYNQESQLNYRRYAWWKRSLNSPDQLRQRVAFALMQIVVINDDANIFNSIAADNSRLDENGPNQPRFTGICHYYDKLIEEAFGNYRTVLGNVAYHPVMGNFLTHINNVKPSGPILPDENFAREILQLFSMGEYRTDISGVLVRDRAGNLIPNYTTGEDIKALARVFTGMQYARGDASTSVNLHDPMEIRNFNNHDFDEKVFPNLRFTLPARTPSVANANAEINEAIDHIYAHPNVGPYIARILIQRLVKANPSTTYIRDVATVFNDDGDGNRGNLRAVVKAILLHKEALQSQRYQRIRQGRSIVGLRVRTKGTEHSKLVEPIVRYTQFIKMFNGQPRNASVDYHPANDLRLIPNILDLSQLPYQAPSVFNYFRPDYQPQGYEDYATSRRIPNGALYSPEAQIYTPVFANRFQNVMYRHLHNDYASNDDFNRVTFYGSVSVEEGLAAAGRDSATPANSDFSELLEHLDLKMCHGSLSEASKTAINSALVAGVVAGNTNDSELARLAIFGVFGTPESAIDE